MIDRDEQMLAVITAALVAFTALNVIATALAGRAGRAAPPGAPALGTTPRQVTAGLATAQVLPSAILRIPLGSGLFKVASYHVLTQPAGLMASRRIRAPGEVRGG